LEIRALPDIAAGIDHAAWQFSLGTGSLVGVELKVTALAESIPPDTTGRKLVSADLLTGAFKIADQVSVGLKQFKLAAQLACSVLVLHVAMLSMDAWRTARERQTLEREIRAIFLTSFPQATAVVDAPLQMARNLRQLQKERGLTAEPIVTKLALAASITREVAPQITGIGSKDGVLTLAFTNLSADNVGTLRREAAKNGAAVVAGADGNVSLVIRTAGGP
jgi:general secretion pathway protein L